MTVVVLLSATEMKDGFVNLKEKRWMKHIVTILVGVTILFALFIVIGIILAFELPPRNRKISVKKVASSQDEDVWKRDLRAVFAVNVVGTKDLRFRRSNENVKRFIMEVIKMLLIKYYSSEAQFAIELYSVPGNTTISDFCDAACTLKHVDKIEKTLPYSFDNPNQTDAILQYYQQSVGDEPSLYILFVADRSSYRDGDIFKKDMEDSSKALQEIELLERTTPIVVSEDAIHYFPVSIITDGTSASETARIINDRLISYYRSEGELVTTTASPTLDSPQFSILEPSDTATTHINGQTDMNRADIQMVPPTEFIESATMFHQDTGVLNASGVRGLATSSPSSSESNKITEKQSPAGNIPTTTQQPLGITTAQPPMNTDTFTPTSVSNPSHSSELIQQSRYEEDVTTASATSITTMEPSKTTVASFIVENHTVIDHRVISTEPTVIILITTTTTTTAATTTAISFTWTGNNNNFEAAEGDDGSFNTLGVVDELGQFDSTSASTTGPFAAGASPSEPSSSTVVKKDTEPVNSETGNGTENQKEMKVSENSSLIEHNVINSEKGAEAITPAYSILVTGTSGNSSAPGLEDMNFAETTGWASSSSLFSSDRPNSTEMNVRVKATLPKASFPDTDDLKLTEDSKNYRTWAAHVMNQEGQITVTEIPSFTNTILRPQSPAQGLEAQKASQTSFSTSRSTNQQLSATVQESAHSQFFLGAVPPLAQVEVAVEHENPGKETGANDSLSLQTLFPTVTTVTMVDLATTFATDQRNDDFGNSSALLDTGLQAATGFTSSQASPLLTLPSPSSSLSEITDSHNITRSISAFDRHLSVTSTVMWNDSVPNLLNVTNSTVVPALLPEVPLMDTTTSAQPVLASGSTANTNTVVIGGEAVIHPKASSSEDPRLETTPTASGMAIDDFAYSLEGFQSSTDASSRMDLDDFAYSLEDFNVSASENKQNSNKPSAIITTEPASSFSEVTAMIQTNLEELRGATTAVPLPMTQFENDFRTGYKLIDNLAHSANKAGLEKTGDSTDIGLKSEVLQDKLEVTKNNTVDSGRSVTAKAIVSSEISIHVNTPSNSAAKNTEQIVNVEKSKSFFSTESSATVTEDSDFAFGSVKDITETTVERFLPHTELLPSLRGQWNTEPEQFTTLGQLLSFAETPLSSSSHSIKNIFSISGFPTTTTAIPTTVPADAAVFVGSIRSGSRGSVSDVSINKITKFSGIEALPVTPTNVQVTGGANERYRQTFTTQTPFAVEQEISGSFSTTQSPGTIATIKGSSSMLTIESSDSSLTTNGSETFSITDNSGFVSTIAGPTLATGSSMTLEPFPHAETSINAPDIAIEITEVIENRVPHPVNKSINTAAPISLAVFNVTVPSSMLDGEKLELINRTTKFYSYLLLDEVDYDEQNEQETNALPKIAPSIDERPILDKPASGADEPYNNLYSYEVTDAPLPSADEIALERLKLLLKSAKKPIRQFSSKTTTAKTRSPTANVFTITSESAGNLRNTSSLDTVSVTSLPGVTLSPDSPEDITIIAEARDIGGFKQKQDDETFDKIAAIPVRPENTSTTTQQTNYSTEPEFSTQIFDEISSIPKAQRKVTVPKNDVEAESNVLPPDLVAATTAPEIEEIAPFRTNHKRKVHQTSTILKAAHVRSEYFTSTPASGSGGSVFRQDVENSSKAVPVEEIIVIPTRKVLLTPVQTDLQYTEDTRKFEHTVDKSSSSSEAQSFGFPTELPQTIVYAITTKSQQEWQSVKNRENKNGTDASQQAAGNTSSTESPSLTILQAPLSITETANLAGTVFLDDISVSNSTMSNTTFNSIPQAVIFFSKDSQTKHSSADRERTHPSSESENETTIESNVASSGKSVPETAGAEEKEMLEDGVSHLEDELAKERLSVIKIDELDRIHGQGIPSVPSREILDGSSDSI